MLKMIPQFLTPSDKKYIFKIYLLHKQFDYIKIRIFVFQLARIAREQRDLSYQGSVTYHLFSSELGYAHLRVTSDPRIPVYIDEFLNITKAYENNKRGLI